MKSQALPEPMFAMNSAVRLLELIGLIAGATLFAADFALADTAATHAPAAMTPGLIHVEEGLDYSVPPGSGLRFVKLESEFSDATFEGRIKLSGVYYFGRLAEYAGDDRIGLYFMPDAPDAKRLPFWLQRGAVKEMNFQNPDAFIKAVIPARIARAVSRGRRKSARGRVTIWTEGFEAAVSCGSPIYATRFLSVANAPKLYAARGTVERTTC